ncbi:family 43 glycosylhydrolase [Thermophagus sp. OGC60D27]|uniref:family 43 glycosylhydrolase n=1 Tax=Thermophagus sp. OGC60D27 TaxID=3458415 RepID=UPI004037A91B
MKRFVFICLCAVSLLSCRESAQDQMPATVCNPMDLSYRFRPERDEVSRREAADPTIIKFKGEYWMFASKSGGYWNSKDLKNWDFVLAENFPTEDYAPTAVVINDTIYLAVSSKKNKKIYHTTQPETGQWFVTDSLDFPVEDPCLFLDHDQKLYLYWGCSNVNPLYGAQLDPETFGVIGEIKELIFPNPKVFGWEVRGDHNTQYENAPWLEGAWMNFYDGKYYLQYSAPGTLEKSYCDGVYVSDHPLGPFKPARHNPFAYKPEGFVGGAGHGSTFTDRYGNYWHTGTISISVKHKFERRIGFYPAFFDDDGVLYSLTKYGDFPILIPDRKIHSFDEIFPGWMLLSYGKSVTVSSAEKGYEAVNMVDENIRTYWAAKTGHETEWAELDLGQVYDVHAVQMNFAEHNANLYGRVSGVFHRYTIEASQDRNQWVTIVDRSDNNNDNSHQYVQLPAKVNCRYLRLRNVEVPDGSFAVSGFRVFGIGNGPKPGPVKHFNGIRDKNDLRAVTLSWNKSEEAIGYNISYGSERNKLYHNYMVYEDTTVVIRSLNARQNYYFSIEAFNENGITPYSENELLIVEE